MNPILTAIRRFALHPLNLIVVIWVAAVLSRLIKNGTVYGLNYNLFQPDGALYHAYTLHLQGYSWEESARLVNMFFREQIGISYLGQTIAPTVQNVIFTRPLLSLMSLPFVFLFGQYGMLAIPILSFLTIGIVLLKIGEKVAKPYIAVTIFFVLSLSTSINRWMISDLTDGLLVALIAITYFLIYNSHMNASLVVVVLLALLTRPSGPLLVALLLPFALANRKISLYIAILLSVCGTVALTIISPEAAGTQTSGEYTVDQRIQDFTIHAVKVVVVEFGQLFVMDRVLFFFIGTAMIIAILTLRNAYSQSFLALVIACFAMGAWNGALGVNFRYQLPLIFAGAFVILIHFDEIENRVSKLAQTQIQKTR
jgi:hypothetical protein